MEVIERWAKSKLWHVASPTQVRPMSFFTYPFMHEYLENEESLLQVPATEVMNRFAMDWERGEFIFMAHQAEDADGELIPLPKEILPETLLKALPETADSLLGRGKVYRDYNFGELKELCGENEDHDGK